jgi:hypothetical protein
MMNTAAPKPSRPVTVNIGVILLLAAILTSISRGAFRANWGNRLVWVQFGVELIMLVIPFWFILQGKNWARWLLFAYALGGICVAFPSVQHHLQAHAISWLLRFGVINLIVVVGLVALFVPSASKWFRANESAKVA